MVALAIMAIFAKIAIPEIQTMSTNSKLNAYSSSLISSVYLARSEAIKRNASVTLCASSDGSSCTTTANWNIGWIVITGTKVLEYRQALATDYSILESNAANVVFPAAGLGATVSTFTVCKGGSYPGVVEYVVSVNATGRASKTKTHTGICS